MNRETKRAMARQQRGADQAERLQQFRKQQVERQQRERTSSPGRTTQRQGRRGIFVFFSEVGAELRKVNWPNRRTVAAYSVVVLVCVALITAYIFGLDSLFSRAIIALYT